MVERYIQICKNLIKKASKEGKNPYQALLKYRNTPIQQGIGSPAQLMMGRRTRTTIPTCEALLKPQTTDPLKVKEKLQERQKKEKLVYDKHARPLPFLQGGDTVRCRPERQQEWKKALVLPRSYVILDEQGKIFRRNRKHLIKTPEPTPIPVPEVETRAFGELQNPVKKDPPGKPAESPNTNGSEAIQTTTRSERVCRVPRRLIRDMP